MHLLVHWDHVQAEQITEALEQGGLSYLAALGRPRPLRGRAARPELPWKDLARAGRRVASVNWWGDADAPNGVRVSSAFLRPTAPPGEPWPFAPGSVCPRDRAAELAPLRFHPGELTATDLRPFAPNLDQIDQERDSTLVRIAVPLATTISAQAIATHLIAEDRPDVVAVRFELPGILPSSLEFLDLMLARLCELAGGTEGVTVLSAAEGWICGNALRLTAQPRVADIMPALLDALGPSEVRQPNVAPPATAEGIRPPRPGEWDEVRQLFPALGPASQRECLVATHPDHGIMGAAIYLRAPNQVLALQVHVLPEFRRRGIGTRLVECVELDGGTIESVRAVSLPSDPGGAVAFAERLGFATESCLQYFEFDLDISRQRILRRLDNPASTSRYRIAEISKVPREAVVRLLCDRITGGLEGATVRMRDFLRQPSPLALALLDGDSPVAAVVSRIDGQAALTLAWASRDSTVGWMLLAESVRRFQAAGARSWKFAVDARNIRLISRIARYLGKEVKCTGESRVWIRPATTSRP